MQFLNFIEIKMDQTKLGRSFSAQKKIAELGEGISSIWDLEQHVLALTPLEI